MRFNPKIEHHRCTRADCIAILRTNQIYFINETDRSNVQQQPSTKGFQIKSILHEPGKEYSEQTAFTESLGQGTREIGEEVSTPSLSTASPHRYTMSSDAVYSNLTVSQRLDVNASLVVNDTDIDAELSSILGLRTQITNDLIGINRTISILDTEHQLASNENLQIYEHTSEYEFELTADKIEPRQYINDVSRIQTTCRLADSIVYLDLSIILTCLPKPNNLVNEPEEQLITVKLPFKVDDRMLFTSGSFYHIVNYNEDNGLDGMHTGVCFIHSDKPDELNFRSSRFFSMEDGREYSNHNIMCSLQYFRKFEGRMLSNVTFGESYHTVTDFVDSNMQTTTTLQWNVVGSRVELIGNVNLLVLGEDFSTLELNLPVLAKLNEDGINFRVGHSLIHTIETKVFSMFNFVTIDNPKTFKISYNNLYRKGNQLSPNNYICIFHISYERDLIDDISSFAFEKPLVSSSERIKLEWTTNLNTNLYYFIDTVALYHSETGTLSDDLNLIIQGNGREWFTFVDVPNNTETGEIYAIMTIFGNTYRASTLIDPGSPTGILIKVSNHEIDGSFTSINVTLSGLLDATSIPHTLEIHAFQENNPDVSDTIVYVYGFTKDTEESTFKLEHLKNGIYYGIKVVCIDPIRNKTVTFIWKDESNVQQYIQTPLVNHPIFHNIVFKTIHDIPAPYYSQIIFSSNINMASDDEFGLMYEVDVYIHSSSLSVQNHYIYTFVTTEPIGNPTNTFLMNLHSQTSQSFAMFTQAYVNVPSVHLDFPTMLLQTQNDELIAHLSLQDALQKHIVDNENTFTRTPGNNPLFYLYIFAFDDDGAFNYTEQEMFIDGIYSIVSNLNPQSTSVSTVEDIEFTVQTFDIQPKIIYFNMHKLDRYPTVENSINIPLSRIGTNQFKPINIQTIPTGILVFEVATLFQSMSYRINFDPIGGSSFKVELSSVNYESITVNITDFVANSDMTHTLHTSIYDLSRPMSTISLPSSPDTLSFVQSEFDTVEYKITHITGLSYATKYMLWFEMIDALNRRSVISPMFHETEGLPTFSILSVIQVGYSFHVTVKVDTSQTEPININWYYRFYNSEDEAEDTDFIEITQNTQSSLVEFSFENAPYNHTDSFIEAYFSFGLYNETYISERVVRGLAHTGFYKQRIESEVMFSKPTGNLAFTFSYMGDLNIHDVKLIGTNITTFTIVEYDVNESMYSVNQSMIPPYDSEYTFTFNDLITTTFSSGYLQLSVSANIGGDVVTAITEQDLLIDTEACSNIDVSIEHNSDGFQHLHVTNFVDDTPIPKIVKIYSLATGELIFERQIFFDYPLSTSDKFNVPIAPIKVDVSLYDLKYDIFQIKVDDTLNLPVYFYHPDVHLGRIRTSAPSVNVTQKTGIVRIDFDVENFVQIDDNGHCVVTHEIYGVNTDGTTEAEALATTSVNPTGYVNQTTENIVFTFQHLYTQYKIFSIIRNTTLTSTHFVGKVYVDLIDDSVGDAIHTNEQIINFDNVTSMHSSTGIYAIALVYLDMSKFDHLPYTTEKSISYVYNIRSRDETVSMKNYDPLTDLLILNDDKGTSVIHSFSQLDVTFVARMDTVYPTMKQPLVALILNFGGKVEFPTESSSTIDHSLRSLHFTSGNSSQIIDLDLFENESLLSFEYISFEDGSDVPKRSIKKDLTLLNHTLFTATVVESLFEEFRQSPQLYTSNATTTSSSIQAFPPTLSVASKTPTSISLSWTENANGEALVTGIFYVLEYKKASDTDFVSTPKVTVTTQTLTNLESNTSYDFRVTKHTTLNNPVSPIVTDSTTAVDAAPPTLSVTSATSTSVSLSWVENDNGDATVTDYLLEYKKTGMQVYFLAKQDGRTEDDGNIGMERLFFEDVNGNKVSHVMDYINRNNMDSAHQELSNTTLTSRLAQETDRVSWGGIAINDTLFYEQDLIRITVPKTATRVSIKYRDMTGYPNMSRMQGLTVYSPTNEFTTVHLPANVTTTYGWTAVDFTMTDIPPAYSWTEVFLNPSDTSMYTVIGLESFTSYDFQLSKRTDLGNPVSSVVTESTLMLETILVDFTNGGHNEFVVKSSEAVLVGTDVLYSSVPGLFLEGSSRNTYGVFSAEFPFSSFDTTKTNHEIRINQEWIHGSHLEIGDPLMLMNSMLSSEAQSRRAIINMDFVFSNFDESEIIAIKYNMHFTNYGLVQYVYYKNGVLVYQKQSGTQLNKVWGLDTGLPSYLNDSLTKLTLGRKTWVFKQVDTVLTMYITHESNLIEIAKFENVERFPSMSNIKFRIDHKSNSSKTTYEKYLCHSVIAYEW
jgi:hypothetical protein